MSKTSRSPKDSQSNGPCLILWEVLVVNQNARSLLLGLNSTGREGRMVEEHHSIIKKSTGLSNAPHSTIGHFNYSASVVCRFTALQRVPPGRIKQHLERHWWAVREGAGHLSKCSTCLSHSTFVYSPELGLLSRYNLGYFNQNLEATAQNSNRISEEHCIIQNLFHCK